MTIARQKLDAIFERAPSLAERVRGNDPASIVESARALIGQMSEPERIAVLNAHPRIGADPASLSALSRVEQGSTLDLATLRALAAMNEEYEARFGFRFVVFVAGRPQSEIVPVFRERLQRTRAEELATGIDEFLAIARDRLKRAAT
jgi:2-oxo-4-hydroxy-4-carboxy--5-ureidoimidazoline (OHCU) decarboxylase